MLFAVQIASEIVFLFNTYFNYSILLAQFSNRVILICDKLIHQIILKEDLATHVPPDPVP